MSETEEHNGLHRSIDWKQGLLIGIGIPLAILPSIGATTSALWAASIVLWGLSVVQGFLQNMAFAELATAFPHVSGIPGFAQEVFKSKKEKKDKFDRGQFIGGFCAWAYWLVWAPGLAIFIIVITAYLQTLFTSLQSINFIVLNLVIGVFILGGLAIISSRGLKHSATLGLIIGLFSILPITIIALSPFMTGNFHLGYITGAMVPTGWTWDANHILLILGLIVIAQWSACCWEVVAVYGPEYKKPKSDVPKALFACGAVCLIMYVLIQTAVIGTLGVPYFLNPNNAVIAPLQPVAQASFGVLGGEVMILLLIVATVMLIQIGYSAGARAMHSMAIEGNLPKWFAKTNSRGEPMRAIYIIAIFNIFLLVILNGNPVAILASSAIGYVFVFAIALFAYVKAKRDNEMSRLERPYKAPKGWVAVALVLGVLQVPLLLIGAIYINDYWYGLAPVLVGFGVLALYIPLWFYSRNEHSRTKEEEDIGIGAGPVEPVE